MKVNKQLAHDAKKKGICEEWFARLMETEDKGKLVNMYLEGIDFCLSNEYPSNEFIRRHFVGTCEAYGVFLDRAITAGNFRHDDFLSRNLLHKDSDQDGTEKIFHETCLNPVRMFCFCKTRCFCHEPQVKIESVIHAAPEITECRVVDAVFLLFNKCKGIGFNDSDFLFIWKLRQYVSFKKGNDIAAHFHDGH